MGSSLKQRVVVTGFSCLTALGFDEADHVPALRDGRSAAGPISRFDTDGFRTRIGGQCDERHLEAMLLKRWPATRLRRVGVDLRMLLWAVASALENAALDPRTLRRPLPAVLGTTLEGFRQAEQWYERCLRRSPSKAPPRFLRYSTSGSQLAAVAELLGLPLEPHLISNACATGVSAIGRLFRRIRSGECDAGIAGGYDCLGRFIHLGFDSLGALTSGRCAPFDRGRSGFFIGDGAAVLVLERLDFAKRRGARIRGEMLGYGESSDGYHLTHPDPQGRGVAHAIVQCLESAGIGPDAVDYINAHGTATPANDAAEAKGILLALGEERGRRIPVSSTKALVGHTLGAAGAVEQCFCLMAMEGRFLPPQAHLVDPDPECPLNFVRRPQGEPQVVMNNAFGFGGANGVLLARRWGGNES